MRDAHASRRLATYRHLLKARTFILATSDMFKAAKDQDPWNLVILLPLLSYSTLFSYIKSLWRHVCRSSRKRTGYTTTTTAIRLGAKKATSKLKRSRHLGNSSDSEGGKSKAALEEAKLVRFFSANRSGSGNVYESYQRAQNRDLQLQEQGHGRASEVVARCEEFPESKLEAIRMAAALYSKLHGMIKVLKNWKIASPAEQLFDKTECYFAKKRDDTLEQTKVEEEKKFKKHNIHFDFGLLIRIKELMVDISSGCMELALKEKREAKIASESRGGKQCRIKNKTVGWAKTLWRAFQFAFGVYTFAGGQGDRADKITRELGNEIELILNNE
ncbi:hypothetical protein HID58_012609 [Brassica napus]|uniref:Uncharacterized protein n=2 Tax=Brassica napus TaxID=3708 RepID=A0ABQ8E1I9_BRANA|nr:hypothetical protein HID58_012609 [Brassica napus]